MQALDLEYRYVARIVEQGDFAEGIRARIVDRDDAPCWADAGPTDVPHNAMSAMLRPLPGGEGWTAPTDRGEWT